MKKKLIILICLIFAIFIVEFIITNKKNTIEVHIGYQSVTAQTWGALIIKNKKIFEKKIEKKYPDKIVKVIWHDELSGSIINTSMISNKVHIGFMGDMPLILNMYKASTLENYDSKLLAIDGVGKYGSNQSILVPIDSKINKIEDLKGKKISTPIGSSAHFMLMKILKKYNLIDEVEIVHQDVAMASQLLSNNKIDAFSAWEPYPTLLENTSISRKIADGKESEIDYLAGVIVDKRWYESNLEIANLFIDSLEEAHKFIKEQPEEAAKIFEKESGFKYEITSNLVKKIQWDNKIDKKIIENLNNKKNFLIELDQIKDFDIDEYILRRYYHGY